MIRHTATGEVPGPIGTRHPLVTPFQAFATSDSHIVLAGVKDWALFCACIDRDDLIDDPRFQENALRTEHHADLEPILIDQFAQRSNNDWLEALSEVCLIGPMNTIPQIVNDPQIAAREMVVELPHPLDGAPLSVSNSPVKLSRTPAGARGRAARSGEHSLDILRSMLDMTETEVHALVDKGVTSPRPRSQREDKEMNTRSKLRAAIEAGGPVFAPVCLDPLTARTIEGLGYEAAYLSGGGLGFQLAVSEALLTITEVATLTRQITQRSSVPLIVDGGVGFGDALHASRAIWEFEAAGAAAIELEDQIAPKPRITTRAWSI